MSPTRCSWLKNHNHSILHWPPAPSSILYRSTLEGTAGAQQDQCAFDGMSDTSAILQLTHLTLAHPAGARQAGEGALCLGIYLMCVHTRGLAQIWAAGPVKIRFKLGNHRPRSLSWLKSGLLGDSKPSSTDSLPLSASYVLLHGHAMPGSEALHVCV